MPEAEEAITKLDGLEIRGIPVKLELAPVSLLPVKMGMTLIE